MDRREILDVVASVSMILASICLIVLAIRGNPGGVIDVALTPYEAGDALEELEEIEAIARLRSDRFLVMWVSSTCRYCTESMPFYERVLAQPRVPVVAMGRESVEVLREYLAENRVKPDEVVSTPSGVRLYQTPTLLEVHPGLKVARVWIGKLEDEDAIAEVLRLTRSAGGG